MLDVGLSFPLGFVNDMAKETRIAGALSVYKKPATLRMLFLGFSSGLPLLLVLGTLGFWLRESGVDLKTIGFMSWVGLCWGMKWLWAPLVDRLQLPYLTRTFGRRRAWLLLAQIGLMSSLGALAFVNPARELALTGFLAGATAFFGATQDIAIDAYRIESGTEKEQAAFSAAYQTGYRIAMIWAGAGALAIAGAFESSLRGGWHVAYLTMSASMLVGLITTLVSPTEPARGVAGSARSFSQWIYEAACLPFKDFFTRFGWWAFVVLALIATYRISDVVMGVMANPFYQDLGFTKQEVAAVSKVFGVVMTLVGAFIGGVVAVRIGVMKTLFAGAVLSSATNILFSVLAGIGHSLPFLVFTVSADNLAGGLASAAFVAYLSGLTNTAYSATQYALFSSVMMFLPKFLAGFSGLAVEAIGYSGFFLATAALGIPVLFLVVLAGKARKHLVIGGKKTLEGKM